MLRPFNGGKNCVSSKQSWYPYAIDSMGERIVCPVNGARYPHTKDLNCYEVQTTMYKINKLQRYTVQHRQYHRYYMVTTNGI